ncbi:bifunctional ADP-dependent NAD(P)H-hydrate dehydratase/NAD(P)H-hydrate epimerase, partial [ANME-1 cluster archaeon GoMg4]|nr:bifunctional ADP-dependent NAD(P)H-hydrate dehydratase/NAD(P)H-hydrate epimerase [ANME-1 cluster archaeon GoMg4]
MKDKEAYITAEEMAALDENCSFFGLTPLQLMENAGANIATEIKKRFESKEKAVKVTIVAGKGNNGGDAFAAARHLHGFDVKILLIGRSHDLRTEETKRNWRILKESGYEIEEIADSSELKIRANLLNDSNVIIDAIFGTGITGKIREPEATAIDLINESNAFVVATDIPSGLDPDTGEAEKAVRANLTVTFHKAKRGLLKKEAYVGELVVADIGIPEGMDKLAGPGDVRLVVKRNAKSHKGDNGRVLIVGGGPFFGAPTLAALAALRAGADWVTIAAPKSVSSIISSLSPNLIVQSLSSDVLVEKDVPVVSNLIRRHDVLVIGMGLGAAEETKRATRRIIEDEASKKVVVDADGFYGLHLPIQTLRKFDQQPFRKSLIKNAAHASQEDKLVIVTPHAGEFLKMNIGSEGGSLIVPPENMMEERMKFVTDFSRLNNVVTLMKGPTDIISDGTRVKINRTGNAGMTVGGTGDVLAGLIGAFFAITSDAFKAATAAAFVNGSAGDRAFEEKGYGLLATDVIEKIPDVIRGNRVSINRFRSDEHC